MTTHGPYTFDADDDADEDAWLFTSDNGPNGLNPADTDRAFCWTNTATPSGGTTTGPTDGEGGAGDGFIYIECSSPTADGDVLQMELDTDLDASAESWVVTFYSNAQNAANDTAYRVQTNENAAGWVTRDTQVYGTDITRESDGATWTLSTIDLSGLISHATTRVRIQITLDFSGTGSVFNMDPGIDTITITGTALGPNITDVDTDEDVYDGQTGVVITGSTFETEGANSRVRLNSASDGTGTDVVQTDTSWADTSIQFTVSKSTLSFGTVYCFVRNQSLQESAGFAINLYDNLVIDSVTPSAFGNGVTGIVIAGGNFSATEGTGEMVELHDNTTFVEQTETAWDTDEITFTAVAGALDEADTIFCRVTRNESSLGDPSARASNDFVVDLLPPPAFIANASANFADGDPTTEQLTDDGSIFTPGEMKESNGQHSERTLPGDSRTEDEICLQATTDSVAGAQYVFRAIGLGQSGEKLEIYDVEPKVTIAP